MLKVVLFDWDGTCHNSLNNIRTAYLETKDILGLSCEWEEFRHYIGIPTVVQGELVYPKNIKEFVDVYHDCYKKLVEGPLFPGTKEALKTIKEMYTICLVTSKTHNSAVKCMEEMEIPGIFDHMICGDDVKHSKPHPEPVLKGLEYYNIKPNEAVYVGDSAHDIKASKGAKVPVIGVTWGALHRDEIEAEKPDYVADTWEEVIEICKKLKGE